MNPCFFYFICRKGEIKLTNLYDTEKTIEKIILVGVVDTTDNELSLNELEELAITAGCIVADRLVQKRGGIHRGHYIGKGKIEELKSLIDLTEATGIICDDELTSTQLKNMAEMLDTKVMDRTLIILDIFAKHARSAEGKVQVELAQLKYNLSHLAGLGKSLSRLGAGIGTRGPGEKKLELDRRNIRNRISELSGELQDIEKHRKILRDNRLKNNTPIVSIVGYTNAGKSSIMNALTNANVLAENKLFATLDTTTRKYSLPNEGENILLTDTVGFIQKLPTNLIKAFKSTLEELKYADILIHVVDISNPHHEEHMSVVYSTISDLGCIDKPIITVLNKIDLCDSIENLSDPYAKNVIQVSAKSGENMETLPLAIDSILKTFKSHISMLIPFEEGKLLNMIYDSAKILTKEYKDNGVYMEAYVSDEILNRVNKYILQ